MTYITGHILCSVALLTITATSIDRLLALLLGLRYRQVVTLKQTYEAISPITILWVFSIVLGIMAYHVNLLVTSWWGNTGTLLCLVNSTFSYTKIFSYFASQPNSATGTRLTSTVNPSDSTEKQ